MLPTTQRPALQGRLATGHHRVHICSNTGNTRRWRAWVKTEEVDRSKKKRKGGEMRSVLGNMSLRKWQKGNKYLPGPNNVPGSVLDARNTVVNNTDTGARAQESACTR